jgi:hypothetical protein
MAFDDERRTSENANSAKFIILHRNGVHGASERSNVFSDAVPALVVGHNRPMLDTFATYTCYH